MYLPKTYEDFSDKFSEIMKDYQQLGKVCREAGPLERKYQDLGDVFCQKGTGIRRRGG